LYLCLSQPTNDSFSSGKILFRDLNITKVFDLRSDIEIQKYSAPLPSIDGVEVLHIPVFKLEDYSPEMMAKYVRAASSGITYSKAHICHVISFTQEISTLCQWEDGGNAHIL
jgi:hypothetical protein